MTSVVTGPPKVTVVPPAQTPTGEVEVSTLRLSFSRVDTYATCPLKFRFTYVDKLPSPPSPDLSWGSSLHSALEAWWSQKLPEPPPVDVLLKALYDNWDDTGFEGMPREEKLKWYVHAQDVLRRHHERYRARYVPAVACEQWFELDLGDGVQVVGSIDHVARTASGGIGIVDWKTNKRAKTRKQVAANLQLAIYVLAATELWGHDPEWVALDFVVPGVRVTVPRPEIDTEAAVRTLQAVAAHIRAETFEPSPSALCAWCDYRALCPAFEGDGPDVPGLAVVELTRLRRRRERDAARIVELEGLVRERLGPEVTVEFPAGEAGSGEPADKPDSADDLP
ncbi:MAG: PD-(D/E)XK nuclease family protein [Chloroflexota bacterium]|nr:PD-(D/E)XK nuclease family protein [Chloroflexota bacterium]